MRLAYIFSVKLVSAKNWRSLVSSQLASVNALPTFIKSIGQNMRVCRYFALTLRVSGAQPADSLRGWVARVLVAVLLVGPPALAAPDRENLTQLRQNVVKFLENYYESDDIKRLDIEVSRLDSRLRLTPCEQPLRMKLDDPELRGGNISVHTRCSAPRPWALYVPAQVDVYRPLPVASRSLGRGHRITEVDVVIELRNTGQLRRGFVTRADTALGQELTRPLNKGDAFRLGILTEPLAVERGDHVRLKAHTGAISVDTRGTAMDNGREGEQIRVRNNSSERVIKALVTGPGQVEVP